MSTPAARHSLPAWYARPFAPLMHSTRGYTRYKFRRDFIAGLTVSVVELPQAMAYALIAGIPPQYGIYASIIQGILGALLSSSDHLTTGPTNTQSLLIASAAMPLIDPHLRPELYLQAVFLLTLFKGVIQLGLWGFRAGHLVQFVSRSVLVGVSAGAGVLIIVGQLGPMLGLTATGLSRWPGVLGQLDRISYHLNEVNGRAVLIAVGVIICTISARVISKFVPGPLIGVIAAASLVALLGWQNVVPTIGVLPHTLPHISLPGAGLPIDVAQALVPGAIALAILGGIESVAIAKTIAAKSGERILPNQEFFAQGFKNLVTSFTQCMPGSASFTRSLLDFEAGAQTRYAAVMNAIFVGVFYFALADFARFVPMAALAGVLMVIAVRLIDVTFFRRIIRADRSDAAVLIVTFLAVLLTRLEYAIFIGIFVNILFFLRSVSKLYLSELDETAEGKFIERDLLDRAGERRVVFLQVEGELFFAIADQLRDRLMEAGTGSVSAIVLRLKRCHSIDGTVLDVLQRCALDLKDNGCHLLLCGLRPGVLQTLQNYGLDRTIGQDNLFAAEPGAFTGASKAITRAKKLSGFSIDTSDFRVAGEIIYDI